MNIKAIFTTILIGTACSIQASGQTIQAGQAITISVQGVPDSDRGTINNTYPVSQSGTINMPYIGQVSAAGMLPEALAASLQARYRSAEIYTNPTFQVFASSAESIVSQVVHIGGYARSTGPKPFTNGLTLYQAIQSAGGANEFGSIRRIILYRDGVAKQFDLRTQEAMHYKLRPNDTIEIPQKNWWGG